MFVNSGAKNVYALDMNEKKLQDLAKEYPSVVIPVVIDLSKWDETRKIVESLPGPIHHLVNNAGIFINEKILDTTNDAVDKYVLKYTYD